MRFSDMRDARPLIRSAQIEIRPAALHDSRRPTVVVVKGEVDASNAEDVRAATTPLLDEVADVVVDLRDVSFMSSRGLVVLTELAARARPRGVGYAVLAGDAVHRLFEIVRWPRPAWVFDTSESAMDAASDHSRMSEHVAALSNGPSTTLVGRSV